MSTPMSPARHLLASAALAPDGMAAGHQDISVITPPTKAYGHLSPERVLSVYHWTDRLFSFTCTRDAGLRFENGQFAMIGLEVDGKPLLRAYSVASANYEDHLEFLSIKVPNGPLTSRLAHLQEGDTILVGRKPTGTLLVDNLRPGRNPLPARDRHRPGALHGADQGPRGVRPLRAGDPDPYRAALG